MDSIFNYHVRFPENLGKVSDEQGERFHRDIKEMENRYQRRCDAVRVTGCCCCSKRDAPVAQQ